MRRQSPLLLDDQILFGEYMEMISTPKSPNHPLLITNDNIGVEIELERASRIPAPSELWVIHTDGSLRNGGSEFVFNGPRSGTVAHTAISTFCNHIRAFIEAGQAPLKSARTSTHVHVDMLDATAEIMADTLSIYAIYELVLFRTFAPERINNHFCTKYTDCAQFLALPRTLNADWDSFQNEANAPSVGRYCALNVKSLFKHGTIEFRHMQATWDYDLLIDWVNACLSIKRAGVAGVDFYNRFFTNCSPGFVEHTRDIFPTRVFNRIMEAYSGNTALLNRDIISGIRYVQNSMTPSIRF